MGEMLVESLPTGAESGPRISLCLVVDTDFGFLQSFSKSLRGAGIEAVELRNSARLAENIVSHNPDIVFIDLNPANPHDCVRALSSLKECRFAGRVQLLGRCEIAFLDSFRKIGIDFSLTMLPVLLKPLDFSAVRKIVLEQNLSYQPEAAPDLSLRSVLARDFVKFWYQPRIDLKKKQVVGAEAFARVSHPQHGILSPASFLAGAGDEELTELASRALVSALKMSSMLDELGICMTIAINVSVETLAKLPIVELVSKHRPRNDQWPGLLFDVPEQQAINKVVVLREIFGELEKYGISLAIDNFGRANSSFAVLRYLPISEIKIDSSFVQGCASNKGNANVCKSMIQLAHNFGRKAAAVGIETNDDAQALKALGCDLGQGYLFGRPMTEQQLIAMLTTGRAERRDFCNHFNQGASSGAPMPAA
jgi:EAL domain-containing protein (putative c-di-GMP-specific phosphodiesterase class I)